MMNAGPPRSPASRSCSPGLAALLAVTALLAARDAEAQRRRHRGRPPVASPTAPVEPTVEAPPAPEPVEEPPPPPEPEAPAAPVVAEPAPTLPVEPPARRRAAALDAQLGLQFFGRHLTFNDDLFQQLRPYDLTVAPALAGALEWYPGAHFSDGPASWFGLRLSGEYAVGISSRDSQGHAHDTTAYGYSAGVRVRQLLGPADLGVVLAYGRQSFTVADTQANGVEGIPGVTYDFLRGGLSARVDLFSRFALTAHGAWLLILATGEIGSASYFPRSNAGGVEAGLGAAVAVRSGLEVRLSADWRRYFFAMNPMRDDPYIAGGAVDQYLSATVGVAYRR
jgi:hypothetical protein